MYTYYNFTHVIILILVGLVIYLIYRRNQERKEEDKNRHDLED